MKLKFSKIAGPFGFQSIAIDGDKVGHIRKQGSFAVLTATDGSTFETQGMKAAYAKTFQNRKEAIAFARKHWSK